MKRFMKFYERFLNFIKYYKIIITNKKFAGFLISNYKSQDEIKSSLLFNFPSFNYYNNKLNNINLHKYL